MSSSTNATRTFRETDKQLQAVDLLASKASNILLFGGSRSGKTAILIAVMICRALKAQSRHLILRYRFNHIKTSIWLDTLPKVLDLVAPEVPVNWNKSDFVLEFQHNGSEIWIGGLDDKERTEKILGTEYSTIFFNECSQMTYESVETARTRMAEKSGLALKSYFDCNPPRKRHWAHKLWIENVSPVDGGPFDNPEDYACLLMNPEDNRENLPDGYIENVLGKLSKRQRDRFLLGLWGSDEEGALWKSEWIQRRSQPETLDRVVVAIDPAVTKKRTSDETGIIVAGRLGNWLYVLDDLSDRYSTHEWGRVATTAYRRWNADRIVGEVNNGGDLVEMNIRLTDQFCGFSSVHASRGKAIRAEPISALYEQGRGFHCGEFPELEDQLCTWVPGEEGSPDRLDALVWAATELFKVDAMPTRILTHDEYEDISRY
jgi:hypothetical protein